jgi:hypothetical protein
MFVKKSSHDSQFVSLIFLRSCAVIVIIALASGPLAPSVEIASALFVSFILQCFLFLTRYTDHANDQLHEGLWLEQLTLRFGLDDFFASGGSNSIDWRDSAQKALGDMMSAKSADDLYSSGTAARIILGIVQYFLMLLDFLLTAGVSLGIGWFISGR